MLRDQNEDPTSDRSNPRTWRLLASFTLIGLTIGVATLRGPARADDEKAPSPTAKSPAPVLHDPIKPVYVPDGSAGFLVNAGLAAYMLEAERIYREGTPVADIDKAMRESIFPMGPFELGDQAGLDIAAGMFDTIAAAEKLPFEPLVWKLRAQKRFGIKSGAGVYDYANGKPTGEWSGLAALVPDRGSRVAAKDEIVSRCAKALYTKARELCDRKIVASEEECDLAFVFGIGFAMYLGGPIFYGQQRGW